ncbi:MAG: hypothetical protein R2827_02025 [Bdellovibrionales bacterium]
MLTSPSQISISTDKTTAKVNSKNTLQILTLFFGVLLLVALVVVLLQKHAPSAFMVLALPLVLLGALAFVISLRCIQGLWGKRWFEFNSSGVEDLASLLQLGHISVRELHSVKWVNFLGLRVLRVRLSDDAPVFKGWDEPKGVFIDLYRLLVGPKLWVPDFLIANKSEITNDWAKQFTVSLREAKSNMTVEPESAAKPKFSIVDREESLADRYKFSVERQHNYEIDDAETVVNEYPKADIDEGHEKTEVIDSPSPYLEGFTQYIRPLVKNFDSKIYGAVLSSFGRIDTDMNKEVNRLSQREGTMSIS